VNVNEPRRLIVAHNIRPDIPLIGADQRPVESRSIPPEEFAAVHQPDGTPGKKAAVIAAAIRQFKDDRGVDDYTAYMALRMQRPELFAGS